MKKMFVMLMALALLMATACTANAQERALQGKRVLFVYGGWDGHEPRQCMERLKPWLESQGAIVDYRTSLEVYADKAVMSATDLIIQCWPAGMAGWATRSGVTQSTSSW